MKNSYNLVGLVEKDAQRFCYANQLELRMRILENEAPALRIQDEHPLFMNTSSFDNDLSGLSSGSPQTSFRILSTVTPNSISL